MCRSGGVEPLSDALDVHTSPVEHFRVGRRLQDSAGVAADRLLVPLEGLFVDHALGLLVEDVFQLALRRNHGGAAARHSPALVAICRLRAWLFQLPAWRVLLRVSRRRNELFRLLRAKWLGTPLADCARLVKHGLPLVLFVGH